MQMMKDMIKTVLIVVLKAVGMVANFLENLGRAVSTATQRMLEKLE